MTPTPLDKPAPLDGESVRVWMTGFNLSQEETAEILGIDQSTISRWLSGEFTPPPYLRHALVLLSIDPKGIAWAMEKYPRKDFK